MDLKLPYNNSNNNNRIIIKYWQKSGLIVTLNVYWYNNIWILTYLIILLRIIIIQLNSYMVYRMIRLESIHDNETGKFLPHLKSCSITDSPLIYPQCYLTVMSSIILWRRLKHFTWNESVGNKKSYLKLYMWATSRD